MLNEISQKLYRGQLLKWSKEKLQEKLTSSVSVQMDWFSFGPNDKKIYKVVENTQSSVKKNL